MEFLNYQEEEEEEEKEEEEEWKRKRWTQFRYTQRSVISWDYLDVYDIMGLSGGICIYFVWWDGVMGCVHGMMVWWGGMFLVEWFVVGGFG